ncbi:hypothetical protein AB0D04_36125 [Streptomyces sp. NPDC048483]
MDSVPFRRGLLGTVIVAVLVTRWRLRRHRHLLRRRGIGTAAAD